MEREFFIDNLLVRIHFIVVMIRWTGLEPREFQFSFPGSITSTFLVGPGASPGGSNPAEEVLVLGAGCQSARDTLDMACSI